MSLKTAVIKVYRFFFPKEGFYAAMQKGIVKGQAKGIEMRHNSVKVDRNIVKQARDIIGSISQGDKLGTKIAIISPTLITWEKSIRERLVTEPDYLQKITLDGEFAKAQKYYATNKNIMGLFNSMKITMDDVRAVMGLTLDKLNNEYKTKG